MFHIIGVGVQRYNSNWVFDLPEADKKSSMNYFLLGFCELLVSVPSIWSRTPFQRDSKKDPMIFFQQKTIMYKIGRRRCKKAMCFKQKIMYKENGAERDDPWCFLSISWWPPHSFIAENSLRPWLHRRDLWLEARNNLYFFDGIYPGPGCWDSWQMSRFSKRDSLLKKNLAHLRQSIAALFPNSSFGVDRWDFTTCGLHYTPGRVTARTWKWCFPGGPYSQVPAVHLPGVCKRGKFPMWACHVFFVPLPSTFRLVFFSVWQTGTY